VWERQSIRHIRGIVCAPSLTEGRVIFEKRCPSYNQNLGHGFMKNKLMLLG